MVLLLVFDYKNVGKGRALVRVLGQYAAVYTQLAAASYVASSYLHNNIAGAIILVLLLFLAKFSRIIPNMLTLVLSSTLYAFVSTGIQGLSLYAAAFLIFLLILSTSSNLLITV